MNKEIEIKGEKIKYAFKTSKRAKRMRLTVYCGGELVVVAPRFFPDRLIEKFLCQKSSWILEKIKYLKNFKKPVLPKSNRRNFLKNKEKAEATARERVKYFNNFYGFLYNKITVKNQKTRWGSCSKKGNLNFNYKIVYLNQEQADYLIVHELCHLKEFNHGPRFWELVSKTIPNYKKFKKELRKL